MGESLVTLWLMDFQKTVRLQSLITQNVICFLSNRYFRTWKKDTLFKTPKASSILHSTFYKARVSESLTNVLLLIISQIPNGNASELIFNTVHVRDAGFYVCRVNNSCTFEFSQWSQLDVCDATELTESFQGKQVEC